MAKRTLSNVDTNELAAELKRRQRRVPALEKKREKLLAQLDEVEAELAELGAAGKAAKRGGGGGGKRPRNETNLLDALYDLLNGKEMTVSEAAEAVQKAGYKSNAANFRTIVNQALLNKSYFKRVERGVYTSK